MFSTTPIRAISIFFAMLIGTLLLDLTAIGWLGLWLGFTKTNYVRAVSMVLLRIMVLPWIIYIGSFLLLAIGGSLGSDGEWVAFFGWFTITFIISSIAWQTSKNNLIKKLRSIAAQPRRNPASSETGRLGVEPDSPVGGRIARRRR